MADNTQLNAGTGGDLVRTIDRTSAKTQVMALDVGGEAGPESLVDATHGLPVKALGGENHIGAVGGNSAVAGGSFVRPANTTAYAIGNLVANSTTAGSVAPIPCAVARVNAGTGVIRRVRLSASNTGFAGTETFRVHLFKLSPTVANGDGGAFSANGIAAIAIGYVDVTMTDLFSDGAKGYAAADIVFDANAGSQNIYALIESRVAFTPVSGSTWTVALEALQD